MTEAELLVIEERAAAATPEPWHPSNSYVETHPVTFDQVRDQRGEVVAYPGGMDPGNALFIAAARSDVPALIAEVRRLQGLALEAREALVPRVAKLPVTMEDLFERSRAAARIVDRMRLP